MIENIWFTTTKLEDRLSHLGRSPWGLQHARRDGDAHTACGLASLNWKTFWHLSFQPMGPDACPECREAIVFIEASETAQLPTGSRSHTSTVAVVSKRRSKLNQERIAR